MALRELKQKAIELRKQGASYSQIKAAIGVSKSTLHYWLYNMPLSEERIRLLRDKNPIRIERCRNTKQKHKEERLSEVYDKVSKEIGKLNDRELLIAGLSLYWGEGTKSSPGMLALTNTNPGMIQFYLKWLGLFNVKKEKIRVKLHIYADMDIAEAHEYWSKITRIPLNQFYKPYIKESSRFSITYKNGFGHGTCSVVVSDTKLKTEVMAGLKYLHCLYAESAIL